MTAPSLLALLLFGVLATIEWRRADRSHRRTRVALNGIAVLALLLLTLQANWPVSPATPAPTGSGAFAYLDAPDQVALGESFTVRGVVRLSPGDSGWITLHDPMGRSDSVAVGGEGTFTLRDRPRAVGGTTYQLSLGTRAGVTASDTLGVAVVPPPLPALLVLDASPSFETAYLKRWLASRGARLTIRTRLTRDRFRTERVNDPMPLGADLRTGALAAYDAILADAGSLAALAPTAREAVAEAVERHGVGLLLTAGTPGEAGLGELTSFAVSVVPGELDRRVARPAWRDAPDRSSVGIEVAPLALDRRAGSSPLVTDESGRWLAAVRAAGKGQVAVTLVRGPSRWQLEGDPDRFAAYWSLLLGAVARDTATEVRIEGAALPRADRRLEITLIGGGDEARAGIQGVGATVEPLALARDPFDPRRWSGTWWPRDAGWHAVRLGGREVPFLVAPARPTVGAGEGAPPSPPRRAATTVMLFLLLLGSLTWLWAESRRRGA